ncbi:hypothetical protein EYF80_055399 [Liparis tanakae]|uniref:Uncharacterized protein n=1 Tax=Liparis tanakae TaxID=230148 RepID=A0A4Z2EZQ2_9TELE|nr:hypothetical protein EYF80_055399 [Liparis tanakae]
MFRVSESRETPTPLRTVGLVFGFMDELYGTAGSRRGHGRALRLIALSHQSANVTFDPPDRHDGFNVLKLSK